MREKAPGSGGPAAGKPEGVKSGAKLFEEVKNQVQSGGEPPEDKAPATATVRGTNADGSANPDQEVETDSAEGEKLMEEGEKRIAEDQASDVPSAADIEVPSKGDAPARSKPLVEEPVKPAARRAKAGK